MMPDEATTKDEKRKYLKEFLGKDVSIYADSKVFSGQLYSMTKNFCEIKEADYDFLQFFIYRISIDSIEAIANRRDMTEIEKEHFIKTRKNG